MKVIVGKVVPFRKSAQKVLERANAQVDVAFRLIALLKRREMNPKDGSQVIVMFNTPEEAQAFQNLLCKLPKRTKRKK